MTARPVTVYVPEALYDRIQTRAESRGRSVETEVVDLIATALAEERLTPDLDNDLAQLSFLDDDQLWRAARSRTAAAVARRLSRLNRKSRDGGLTEAEERTRDRLLQQYDRAVLVRAQAAVLLKQRGHDIDSLLEPG